MGQSDERLPSAYQEVEYLESNGDQYIITSYLSNPDLYSYLGDTELYIEFSIPKNYESPLFGCRYSYKKDAYYIALNTNGRIMSNGCVYYNYGSSFKDPMPNLNVDFSTKSSIKVDKNTIEVNGSSQYNILYNYEKQNFRIWQPFTLFGGHDNVIHKSSIGTRIYTVKIDNELANEHCNFIPCYRKSDNKPGMYNLCGSICPLTGTPFYINAGTGEFTCGRPVIKDVTFVDWIQFDGSSHINTGVAWSSDIRIESYHVVLSNETLKGVAYAIDTPRVPNALHIGYYVDGGILLAVCGDWNHKYEYGNFTDINRFIFDIKNKKLTIFYGDNYSQQVSQSIVSTYYSQFRGM